MKRDLEYFRMAPDVVIERILNHRDALLRAMGPLNDLIANARLLKQCPEPDGCDICRAEKAVRDVRAIRDIGGG